jgi:thioredoxin:protein disulfide reductase
VRTAPRRLPLLGLLPLSGLPPLPGGVSLRSAPLRCALLLAVLVIGFPLDVLAAPAFDQSLTERPIALTLAAYGSGLLSSLTPCVYPMVAITVSVFGASKARSRWHAFALSFVFVMGLVAMFVPLGLVAALTGKTFGSALSNVWVNVGLAALFVVLAASMFGAFDLDLPSGIKQKLASAGGSGFIGAFILGMVCGPIAAPCTGPFLYGLLAFIAQSQSLGLGSASMTAFAFGLGTPFFLVGAFALQLPKSGRWLMHIKSFAGILLLIVALYFVGNSFEVLRAWVSPGSRFLALMAGLVVLGLALGAVHASFEGAPWTTRVRKGLAVTLVTVASFGFVTSMLTPDRRLAFERPQQGESLEELVARARATAKTENRPVFLDFTAAWCTACKDIEKQTFPDERVQKAAGRYVAVQLDMTNDDDPAVGRAFAQYAIRGLPTLILLDSEGEEKRRFFGDFVGADELATAMEAVD